MNWLIGVEHMKIFIGRLRKELGAREEFSFLLEENPPLGEEGAFTKPISARGSITNTGGDFLDLEMEIDTEVELSCSRCLEPVILPFHLQVTEQYCHEEDRGKYFVDEDDGMITPVVFYNDEWLDLSPIVQETIMLNIPMRVLCTPDCPGLCPVCGKNRKEDDCDCPQFQPDPRLEVLTQLRAKLQS
jgi:uncharacterized protein